MQLIIIFKVLYKAHGSEIVLCKAHGSETNISKAYQVHRNTCEEIFQVVGGGLLGLPLIRQLCCESARSLQKLLGDSYR